MVYKYLNGSQVYIYPSANSDDGGDVNNEGNLKTLFGSTTDNFVIRDSNGFELNVDGQYKVYIDAGEAIIDGHYIKTKETSRQSSSAFLSSMGYDISEGSNPHLVIALLKDTTGNARGDLLEGISGSYVRVAKGVGFTLTNTPEQIPDSIDLGTLTINNGNITDYEINENAYKYINVSDIKLSETGSLLNSIYINSDGEFDEIQRVFVCDTAADVADKVINDLPVLQVGDKVRVQFTNANTVLNNIKLNNDPIYLSNKQLCQWYSISNTATIYEFIWNGNAWGLINPTETRVYSASKSEASPYSGRTLNISAWNFPTLSNNFEIQFIITGGAWTASNSSEISLKLGSTNYPIVGTRLLWTATSSTVWNWDYYNYHILDCFFFSDTPIYRVRYNQSNNNFVLIDPHSSPEIPARYTKGTDSLLVWWSVTLEGQVTASCSPATTISGPTSSSLDFAEGWKLPVPSIFNPFANTVEVYSSRDNSGAYLQYLVNYSYNQDTGKYNIGTRSLNAKVGNIVPGHWYTFNYKFF